MGSISLFVMIPGTQMNDGLVFCCNFGQKFWVYVDLQQIEETFGGSRVVPKVIQVTYKAVIKATEIPSLKHPWGKCHGKSRKFSWFFETIHPKKNWGLYNPLKN